MMGDRARPFAANYRCPVDLTLHVIGGKWKPLILWELHAGPRRFNALMAVVGITHKVLTQQLRELERREIVVRTVRAKGERHIEYALSPFGRTLRPVLNVMARWADTHHRRMGATIATRGKVLPRAGVSRATLGPENVSPWSHRRGGAR